jgi:DNA-binding transcriptional LysR family regulator
MMLEARLLQQVVVLAETRSFTKASKVICLSQPALSRSIQNLESQLGVALFDRSRKEVKLTEAGLLFVNRAKELLVWTENLEKEVSLFKGVHSEHVSVGAGPYAAELFLVPMLKALLTDYPELSFHVSIDHWVNQIQKLRRGKLDIVVADYSEVADNPDLDIHPLTPYQGYFIVRTGHPLADKKAVSVDEIFRYPLAQISHMPVRLTGRLVTRSGKSAARTKVGAVTDNLYLQREIIKGSQMVGMFTMTQVEKELNNKEFVVLPCRLDWLHGRWGVITARRQKPSPVEQLFISLALEADLKIAKNEMKLARRFLRI